MAALGLRTRLPRYLLVSSMGRGPSAQFAQHLHEHGDNNSPTIEIRLSACILHCGKQLLPCRRADSLTRLRPDVPYTRSMFPDHPLEFRTLGRTVFIVNSSIFSNLPVQILCFQLIALIYHVKYPVFAALMKIWR